MAAKDRLIGASATVMSIGGTAILAEYESAELRFERPLVETTAIKDTDGAHFLPMHTNAFVAYTATFRKKIDTVSVFKRADILSGGTLAWSFTEASGGRAYSGTAYVENVSHSTGDGVQTEEVTLRGEGTPTT